MTQNRVIQSISVILWHLQTIVQEQGGWRTWIFPRPRAPKLETVFRLRGYPRQVKSTGGFGGAGGHCNTPPPPPKTGLWGDIITRPAGGLAEGGSVINIERERIIDPQDRKEYYRECMYVFRLDY